MQAQVLFVTEKLSAVHALEISVLPVQLVAVVAQISRRIKTLRALHTVVNLMHCTHVVIELRVAGESLATRCTTKRKTTALVGSHVVNSLYQHQWTCTS